jgi:cytochrome c peroxidase
MKHARAATPWVAAFLATCVSACTDAESAPPRHTNGALVALQQEPLQALPQPVAQDPLRVGLGAKLFSDPKLSADGTIACASCHVLAKGGVDGRPVSVGIQGRAGSVNAPTVLNCSHNFVQFWDGRAATLEEQMGFPLTDADEMGSEWPTVLAYLKADAEYRSRFQAAFVNGISEANVRSAIATFERTLETPDARFDSWLRGDKRALTDAERAGYERFKAVGCVACHQGSNVGGNMFQRFGVMGEYFQDRGHIERADYGRFNVTHLEADRFVFRVPSLRNVELTAPYFHDGSASTLEQAVGTMAKYQLGQTLDAATVAQIVAFLKTLTGRAPDLAVAPSLLARGANP